MMKRLLGILFICALAFSQSVVRVYCGQNRDLTRIEPKVNLDIAGARSGEWFDIVADRTTMDRIIVSGLPYEIQIYDLEYQKNQVRGQYHSYDQLTTIMRNWASTYSSICKLDSLPLKTYQGRWVYGVKISDNPGVEEENEPGLLVDGCHHAREWATPQVVRLFCDSLLKTYATSSEVQQIVNNIELYCFPVINVDGYVYDYSNGGVSWRRNRKPFGSAIGCDVNRDYAGCANIPAGDWGAVDDGKATHYPGNDLFCGARPAWAEEITAMCTYAKARVINAYMSYHSYSELLMWGWGFSTATIPDNTVVSRFGNRMAGMINRLGGGTYQPGQIPVILYSVSGGSIDWFYSCMRWVCGVANISYTTEVGTSFYQPVADLDGLCLQNFKALKYLAQLTRDSVPPLVEGVVPPPQLSDIGTVSANFTVRWHPLNTSENHPTRWELVELSNPSIKTDSLESGTGRWTLNGFTLSTAQAHSATHSFFSGNTSGQNTVVTSIHPYLVQTNDSLTFWCYYNLENNYDVAVAEVSENNREWFDVDTARFTGSQTSWQRKAYSLAAWVGKSIFIRFRSMYDDGTQNTGFYVDDIRPTCLFGTVTSISQNITDTLYQFTSHAIGTYYYYVRGDNAAWDWGEYSTIKRADVIVGVAEENTDHPRVTDFRIRPQVSTGRNLTLEYDLIRKNQLRLTVYDISGRAVSSRQWENMSKGSVSFDLPNLAQGVYFAKIEAEGKHETVRLVLIK
jgi:hypothetical protein